ncbi:MAG TPA: PAS domain S-box protein, partial [Polyangiaceae bacterium]
IGKNAAHIVVPTETEHIGPALSTIRSHSAYEREWQFRRKAGSSFPADVSVTTMPDGSLLALVRDITARKQADEALRKTEARHAAMIANIGDLIAIIDGEGILRYQSPNVEKLFGWRPDEIVGRSTWELVHPDDLERTLERFRAVMDEPNASSTIECRYRRKDGGYDWIEITAVNLLHDPNIRGLLANYHDVTERRAAEESLRRSLKEKDALLKEVHHRVKNNLQVINSLLRLEAARNENPSTRTVLGEMQGRTQSMALLHESLYRSGTFAGVDLGAYLKQLTTQSFRAQGHPGSIRLELDLASASVGMDRAVPCGLLVNELVSNGLKHGFPDGRAGAIRVELKPVAGGAKLRLCVSDTGVGLPADFEVRRGNSLGLQLVSDLAGQLGGELEIGPPPIASFAVTFAADERNSRAPVASE